MTSDSRVSSSGVSLTLGWSGVEVILLSVKPARAKRLDAYFASKK